MKMTKIYAGIGSRNTPSRILELMEKLGEKLARKGTILRSGGARGADSAFEQGARTASGLGEVYLVNGYRRLEKSLVVSYEPATWEQAEAIAKQFHPCWGALKFNYVHRLMIRSTFQVLGIDLKSPADFVLCWTPDGSKGYKTSRSTGGTGQALRLAYSRGIRIYNLANPIDFKLAQDWVNS